MGPRKYDDETGRLPSDEPSIGARRLVSGALPPLLLRAQLPAQDLHDAALREVLAERDDAGNLVGGEVLAAERVRISSAGLLARLRPRRAAAAR